MRCGKCGVVLTANSGYAFHNDVALCSACSAAEVEEEMYRTGRAVLYLVRDRAKEAAYLLAGYKPHAVKFYVVTDWFGILRFPVHAYTTGAHSFAGTQTHVWFCDKFWQQWHGVQYGSRSELCYCRRTKAVCVPDDVFDKRNRG